MKVPGVACYDVAGGNTVVVDPEEGADHDSIRLSLLGSALGALLCQRGLLVLHGNAVRVGDRCLVCVGPSGAGKSTLAAGFLRHGHEILADDVVPVDETCRVLPGFPRLKLWRDVASRLDIDTARLRRVRPDVEKYSVPLAGGSAGQALPVRWVYVLESHDRPEVRLEEVEGMGRFLPLRRNSYGVRVLEGMALEAENLLLCGRLARQVRLARVTRPVQGFHLEALVDRILEDVEEHP